MTQDTEDVVARLRRESQRVFPLNMRDGHAYHSVAAALDKGADLIQSLSDRIDEQRKALEWIADHAAKLRKGTDDWFELVEFEAVARAALHQEGIAP